MSDEITRPDSEAVPFEDDEPVPDEAWDEAAEALMFGALPDAQNARGRRLA